MKKKTNKSVGTDVPGTIGDRIKAARLAKQLTQPQLAVLLELSNGAISQWETNDTSPKGSNLLKLCAHLGVSPTYIMEGAEPESATLRLVKADTPGADPLQAEASELLAGLSPEKLQLAASLLRHLADD